MAGTALGGVTSQAQAQEAVQPPATGAQVAASAKPAPPPVTGTIKSLRVDGSQRIEPETVLSYTKLRIGIAYTNETLDQAIRDLLASDLFADVSIAGVESGDIVVRIRENPVINRVVFEGNKRIKQDKFDKEIKLKPRQIFTRSAVRADVARIIELYRRQGRFAAVVEPKMVALDQNRVDVIFEITEGAKSKVRQINIIGNKVFSDNQVRAQMATKQARFTRLLSSATSYDQDRLAYDQQKLRQFYLTEGYADFKVVSAVAELTPDKRDFIITYVVDEGPRYHFGEVTVDSDIRDFDDKKLAATLPVKKGDWYNAKMVEDSVTQINETAGTFGYAFADVNPEFNRDRDTLTMGINFHIAEAKRTYVERVEINGNTNTQDKVIRREMRLAEGDPFNTFSVKRSQDRINSLGYFQDKFELKQTPGSTADRVVLNADLQEKATGELTLSAGYSSLERFIIQASIKQRNFRGKGQELRASVNYSYYSKSVELGFTEPYLFDKNIALGGDIFRRDYNAFNYNNDERQTTYSQVSTGFQLRAGLPLTEFWSLAGRYGLSKDDVTLDRFSYFTDSDGNGIRGDSPGDTCDRLQSGNYLCDSIGNRITSSVGFSLIYDNLNNRLRPSKGQRLTISEDFAGLGGDVRYIRSRVEGAKYVNLHGFVLSAAAEGGYIKSLEASRGPGIDKVRITDRFYLGEPQFHGFDIRGVGPRIQRLQYTTDANGNETVNTDRDQIVDDALGGRAYYLGKIELEPPLGSGISELGLRPSIYVQVGALFGITRPLPTATFQTATDPTTGKLVHLPKTTPITDSAGHQLYSYTDASGSVYSTPCATGYDTTCNDQTLTANTALANSTAPFEERFLGNSAKPRLSVGIGVNWNSPFGPLRIDIAKALLTAPGDDPKLVTFNVGTQF